MKMLRAAIVVIVVLAGLTVLALPSPVQACDCALRSEQEVFSAADAVFTGTVTARFDANAGALSIGGSDPIIWTFAVDSIAKGAAANLQAVTSVRDEGTCGYEFKVGERYQVYAQQLGTTLKTGLCSGTRPVGGTLPAVPLPTGPPATGQGARPATAVEQGQHDRGPSTAVLAVTMLVLAATGGAIITWRRHRGM